MSYRDPGPTTHWVNGVRHNLPLAKCAECRAALPGVCGWAMPHEAMRDDKTSELVCIHCGEVKP